MALPNLDNCQLEYVLNQTSGNTVTDTSPNGYDGTKTATASWVNAPTRLGKAIRLDSTNPDYIDAGAIFSYEYSQAFSLESWFYPTLSTGNRHLMGKMQDDYNRGYAIAYVSSGNLESQLRNSTNNTKVAWIRTTGITGANNPHHIVATFDGTGTTAGMKIYDNAIDMTVSSLYDNLSGNTIINAINFNVGSVGGSAFAITGDMNRARVYNVAVTSGNVTSLYNGGSGISSLFANGSDDHIKRYYYR